MSEEKREGRRPGRGAGLAALLISGVLLLLVLPVGLAPVLARSLTVEAGGFILNTGREDVPELSPLLLPPGFSKGPNSVHLRVGDRYYFWWLGRRE